MNESANPIIKYFSEFKILKTVSKDFWLTNVVQFFDGMAYFSLITVFVLYLTDYCSFNDADAALWVGLYTLFISAFVFAVGSICDIIGIRRTYLIGFIILIAGRLIMGFGPDLSPTVDSGRLVVMTGILIMSFGHGVHVTRHPDLHPALRPAECARHGVQYLLSADEHCRRDRERIPD